MAKFYHYNSLRVKRWKGLRIYGVDGSSVNLPDSRELGEYYGFAPHRAGGSPTARVSVLYDVLNELVIKSSLHPFCTSERDMACEYMDHMDEDTIFLFDRGYPSFWFIYLMILRKPSSFFLMRCRVDFSTEMKEFVKSASKDKVLDFLPSYQSMEKLKSMGILISPHTTIKLRVLSVLLPTGKREILITNLMDQRLYTARELKELYYLRWRVETFYSHMKNQLQLEQFSGIRSICIEQDFAANMFLFNLQSLIQKQCEPYLKAVSKKRRYAYKINRNISFANLKYRLVGLFLKEKLEIWLKELQLLFEKSMQAIKTNRGISS